MLENITGDDVLLDLATYTSKGNWPIITRSILLSFLEYGSNISHPPVLRHLSGVEAHLED